MRLCRSNDGKRSKSRKKLSPPTVMTPLQLASLTSQTGTPELLGQHAPIRILADYEKRFERSVARFRALLVIVIRLSPSN
jgi:hypothetical protein